MTKVAIVGGGFGLYGLLPAFHSLQGCKVVSICSEKTERLLNDCKKRGIERVYTDWKEMLDAEKPDAVAIAVIPKYQYEIARYALSNDMAVFAEKPLALTVKDASELCELATRKKLPNTMDFLYPEIPEWAEAKRMLANDRVGKVLDVKVEWKFLSHDLKNAIRSWKTDPEQGGGALLFYLPHVFYYLEYFLGRIKELGCTVSTSEKSLNRGETAVDMAILFENGCTGKVNFDSAYTGQQKHTLEFRGEGGTLLLQNNSDSWVDNFELVLVNAQGTRRIKPDIQLISDSAGDQRVKLVRIIAKRFISWCNTGIASKPDFQDGLRVQQLIEMAKTYSKKVS